MYYVKHIIERLNLGYGKSKFSLQLNGKQYDILCGKSGYEISNSGEDDSPVRYSSIEELYAKYMIDNASLKSQWNKIERFTIQSV